MFTSRFESDESMFLIDDSYSRKLLVLVIYDIVSNKKRTKLAKFLCGYGFRVQKSAFEAHLSQDLYNKLLSEIEEYVSSEDSVRIYKIIGSSTVTVFGQEKDYSNDDVVII